MACPTYRTFRHGCAFPRLRAGNALTRKSVAQCAQAVVKTIVQETLAKPWQAA